MVWTNQINIALQKARKYYQMWTDRRVMILGMDARIQESTTLPESLRGPASLAARGLLGAINHANNLRLGAKVGQVEQIERFDERFDELAKRSASSMGIAPVKSSEYLNWKYVDRPHLDASCLQLLDESGQLAGFAVIVNPDTTNTACITELAVVDNDQACIHTLLEACIRHLHRLGTDRIEAVATSPAYVKALQDRLFRRIERIPLFLANDKLSPHAKKLHSPRNWHLSLGDSEGPF
jgi:hypothetical protein